MRRSLLQSFDEIYILDLHGNRKKQEQAPDGSKDENVFDIQQGVAINIFVKWRGISSASGAQGGDGQSGGVQDGGVEGGRVQGGRVQGGRVQGGRVQGGGKPRPYISGEHTPPFA